MAIVDYSTLQASVAGWLARADLSGTIPDFISLGEARINRDLRVRRMQVKATGTAVSGAIPFPADCMGIISLKVAYAGGEYEIYPVGEASRITYQIGGVLPFGYTVVGSTIELDSGLGNLAYTLTYWQRIPPLSNTNQQNWLLSQEPGLYLYGALIEASPFIQDDERTTLWAAQFKGIVDRLQARDNEERYGNAAAPRLSMVMP